MEVSVHGVRPAGYSGASGHRGEGRLMEVTERYVLGRLVGEGATACVYEASDTVLEREVAVKVFHTADPGDGRSERFSEEIRILTSLVHPHLLPLYDTGRDGDGRRFIVMPLVRGTTLARLTASGPVPPREVKRIGKALAGALAHVHARGIVHRDVKPGNVLLDDDGTPYLADFGFAHAEDGPALTATDCVVGTAGYLAPEQAEGLAVPPVADVYALGLVLLEALTGERTYRGTPIERAAANALRPPEIPARLGPGWLTVLRALTARNPAVRPTAEEAASLLDAGEDEIPEVTASDDTMELTPVLFDLPEGLVPAASAVPAAPRETSRRLMAGAAALAAVAVFGVGAGTNWLAFGSSNGGKVPAPAGPGAGAAGPQQPETPTSTSASTPPPTATAPGSTHDAVRPTTRVRPADQVLTASTNCQEDHGGKGHGKHRCH
ncbi:serine/threonine-protein kinase [Catenulispora subtropica]